jgi:hypothetical protein
MKLVKKAGAVSEIWQIFISDSSSTTGAGLTGLANNTAGLTAYYHRDTDGAATVINLVTMTVGTFTSSGFKEIDATNMPGWYQFCPPNAALASGAKSCAIHLKGATNMAPLPIEVQLSAVDPDDATAFGVSRIDAAISSRMATFTLPTNFSSLVIDANGRVDLSKWIGVAVNALNNGCVQADVERWLNVVVNAVIGGRIDVDLTYGLETKTYGEPSGVVGATAALKDMINWLKALGRNKITQTSTVSTLRNDGDSASLSTSAVSDDGTTFTRAKWS